MSLFRLRRFDRDVGTVLAAFIVFIAIENLVIGLGFRSEFVGTWEMGSARLDLSPIVLACSLPIAITSVLIARLVARGHVWPLAIAAGLAGVALGIGVSTGRRVSVLPIRIPFVAVVALACGLVAWVAATQLRRVRSRAVISLGVFLCLLAWLADARVLPRLYPAFHTALIVIALLSWSTTALLLYGSRHAQTIAFGAIVITGASIAWSPFGAKRVHSQDNLRRVLLEHAPLLGRAVLVAAKAAPPPPVEDDDGVATTTLTSLRAKPISKDGAGRPLDWKGHDIVLVTIDALRADHVSAYGYPRKTTPNIDALAARGVRFDRAYCPTPHTSYSITSMMTGTYVKPLLALGDEVSIGETWPVQLRRYGYRTAAFYPPAVFFIDEHRFTRMRDENLGFEYYKEEFARPELRQAQVEKYLQNAPKDKPLFLWVHLFEPHEPYEMHAKYPFEGDPKVDAYDSEIAAADAFVGALTQALVAKRPPGGVMIVSADHGEEHGDHGGRYHGTTVFEEQVRVPLVVVAPGVAPHVVTEPVQTIDLLPTTLAALDIPLPPRLRGRDLGPAIAGRASADPEGLAFSETDDYTLLARGNDRLICQRKVGACSLFDVADDPEERRPVQDRPDRVTALKKLTAAIERETGKVEASALPDALRRGLQGDRDAAEDVAPLLEDARIDIRRLAARCAFKMRAPEMATQLRRSMLRDEDEETRRWAALALLRIGDLEVRPDSLSITTSLKGESSEERGAAALALVERGEARGEPELLQQWTKSYGPNVTGGERGELDEAREMLAAFTKAKSRTATPVLVKSLDDVRLRPYLVEALGDIGDYRAKDPILRVFTEERYVHLRPIEGRALVKLGAKNELVAPLTRFAGTPEPMIDAIFLAREAKILVPDRGGREWNLITNPKAPVSVDAKIKYPKGGVSRLFIITNDVPPTNVTASVNGIALEGPPKIETEPWLTIFEVSTELRPGEAQLTVKSPSGIRAVWLVPRAAEIPPPPPRAWPAKSTDSDPDLPEIIPDAGL